MNNANRNDFPEYLSGEMLRNFTTAERGCTHPRVGTINGGHFIIEAALPFCASFADQREVRCLVNGLR